MRTVLRKILLSYGNPVQNSVFECRLNTSQFKELIKNIERIKEQLSTADSIRVYTVCKNCIANTIIIGSKPIVTGPICYIV
ncbi:MAG: CRISPR-associated endonuclease Cas2 [Bacteroidota bacterium]